MRSCSSWGPPGSTPGPSPGDSPLARAPGPPLVSPVPLARVYRQHRAALMASAHQRSLRLSRLPVLSWRVDQGLDKVTLLSPHPPPPSPSLLLMGQTCAGWILGLVIPWITLVYPGMAKIFPFYWSDPAEFKTVSILGFFGFSLFSIEFIYDLCIRITF